jgi:toxin ParE1/3/4
MLRVILTEPARRDLVSAAKYVAEKAHSPEAASRFLEAIDERLAVYGRQPKLAEVYLDAKRDCRRFSVGSYVVFYRELHPGIEVLRVLHGSRDIPAVLETEGFE